MVNYVLSFCKITGASRIFSRNFYLPLLKPVTPKEALRTFRITGKWLLGGKIQHYIPVLLNHRKKRSKLLKNFGKRRHKETDDYTYMAPVLDSDDDNHKILLEVLEGKQQTGSFVYTVDDKKYNIVLQGELERAILDGDVIDVLVSQRNDKIIIKLKSMKKIPVEIQYYEGEDKLYLGEGATCPEDEKFHHHGKYTMSLAKIFEDRELREERWEEELRKLLRKRKRHPREGSKEWKQMMKENMKIDWSKFEDEAKKVIDEIDEPAVEQQIDMEIDDLEATQNVNETLIKNDLLETLPTMIEIPEIIRNMGSATLTELETDDKKVTGVKVTLPSGKECFVSGQMVHTEDGDVFVPGQTIENEFGLEYSPGITIIINNKPTLISGLIMGEESNDAMFVPTQSTITADGQLTFATTVEERPPPQPEKQKKKKVERVEETPEPEDVSVIDSVELSSDLNSSEMEDLDLEALRMKQEQQQFEIEQLKAILMDDGLDDILASIEDKRELLRRRLEELRKLSVTNSNSLVSYVSESDTMKIAAMISEDQDTINRLSDILLTFTRRAATFRDKNSVNPDNINQTSISSNSLSEAELKFNNTQNKLKIMLRTAVVAANDVFKSRPQDQILALNSMAGIMVGVLKTDAKALYELLDLMNTNNERQNICGVLFKQLTQDLSDSKVAILSKISRNEDVTECVEKILKKDSEVKCEAFVKIARIDPGVIPPLVEAIKHGRSRVKTEEDAVEVLEEAIVSAIRAVMLSNLENEEFDSLQDISVAFAKALGMGKIEEDLAEELDLEEISDNRVLDFLGRIVVIKQLAERDFSLRSALERIKKNPERARTDPRIRQLIRESGMLISKGQPIRNSRDFPLQLLKTQNLLAIEDILVQRSKLDYPVLVSRDATEVVIPKEASSGVLAGRVPYTLIDESGITVIKPIPSLSSREFNAREKSLDKDDDRTYLQAKSNVRKLKKLLNNNSRQVA